MIKKMWALFDDDLDITDISTDGLANIYIDKKYAERDCNTSVISRNFKIKQTVKPVWVTDKDPFENVRKVYNSSGFKDLDFKNIASWENKKVAHYVGCCLHGTIQKDLKNWDEGAK